MFENKEKMIKIIGLVATLIGLGASLLTEWVNDKKMDGKIMEKVNEAFAKNEN